MLKALSGETYAEGLRSCAIELAGQAEEFSGRELVAELRFLRRRCYLTAMQFPGFALATCIDKNHGIGAADGFCYLWQELSQLQNFYFGRGQSLAQVIGDNPAHTVVAAQRVAVGDNEHSRHFVGMRERFTFTRA